MKKLNQALQKQLAPEEQQQPNQREFQFRAGTENGAKSDQAEKERQRKQREFRRESARLTKDVRQKIEALLTPQQLAGLKDILFRMWSFGSLINPDDQKNLGLSDQQKTDLQRIDREFQEKAEKNEQEMFKKALDILTPGQQEKLHEELDHRGW
jgi:hypothetical protein